LTCFPVRKTGKKQTTSKLARQQTKEIYDAWDRLKNSEIISPGTVFPLSSSVSKVSGLTLLFRKHFTKTSFFF
jgi:hypothetical protein